MWLPDRRTFIISLAALGGCGFTPVYGPQGGGSALLDNVALPEPDSPEQYLLHRRLEERLGRAPGGAYLLQVAVETESQGLGALADGNITRVRLQGTAVYTLRDRASDAARLRGTTESFTAYSTTGSTAATQSAERDAEERLMVILADQILDELLLHAAELAQ
ncbi:MAG: LPS assembly lipoprotein LptE [Salipiger marinus]|uniref:LPS assembly lipoprotein LptE n=1 Tax=Salipiger marinus TaxID=555512 RepID=UPI004058B403